MDFNTRFDRQGNFYLVVNTINQGYIFEGGCGIPQQNITSMMVRRIIKYVDTEKVNVYLEESFSELYKKALASQK